MKPTLPFAQYDADIDHLHILHKAIPDGVTNLYTETFVRQQQAEIEVSENLILHLHAENKDLRIENEKQQAEIEHLKELFGCDPAYFEPDKKAKTLTDDAQYDRGFDAGCKHAEKNLQAEIEALNGEIKIVSKLLIGEPISDDDIEKHWNPLHSTLVGRLK